VQVLLAFIRVEMRQTSARIVFKNFFIIHYFMKIQKNNKDTQNNDFDNE